MPKGDPRAGNYDALLKQLFTDKLDWDALAAQRKDKLKRMHRLAYGTVGEGKKAAYLQRFAALREYWEAYQREAATNGTRACLKGFPDFDTTTANIFKGLCPDGVTCFLSIGLEAESPQVRVTRNSRRRGACVACA